MASELDRRDRRYAFEIPGVILARKGEVAVLTGDVGFRGAFLKTASPPEVRQLIRARLVLPADFEPSAARPELVATGMVAHVVQVRDPKGRTPGAGIEFYGLDGELRRQWEHFIQFVQSHDDSKELVVDEAQARRHRAGARLNV
jgi:PilZ domain-containing protein